MTPRKERRLGRGLDSLVPYLRPIDEKTKPGETLPSAIDDAGSPAGLPQDATSCGFPKDVVSVRNVSGIGSEVSVDKLRPNPKQPRSIINNEDILSLSRSIKQQGLLQPIVVREAQKGYEIIAGERRWRAAKAAGFERVPVLVRQASDEQMIQLALVENLHREDLNAIDRALAYRQFCDDFDLRPEDVAERLDEDRTTVANYLRLLELPEEVQGYVANGQLSMGHARSLVGVRDAGRQLELGRAVLANLLSVRALEEIIRRRREKGVEPSERTAGKKEPRFRSPHVLQLQSRFEEAVKTKVTIHEGKKRGTGRIVIAYYSLDDFDRIAGLLGLEFDVETGN